MMNRSRILLHPSTYEGMSTVMLEALYSGCHVVSFQGLGEEDVRNLTIVRSEGELISACDKILSGDQQAQRILVNDMRETVGQIIGLYL
jgi:glycosyltransferase involved in cell wall biosynthesis